MASFSPTDIALLERILGSALALRIQQPSPPASVLEQAQTSLEQRLQQVLPFVPLPLAEARVAQAETWARYADGTVILVTLAGFAEQVNQQAVHGRQGSEALGLRLNRLLEMLGNLVTERGGYVVTLGGDSFTAIFDNARAGRDHVMQGAAAALAMRARLREDHDDSAAPGWGVQVRIGIHTGQIFAVTVGNQYHRKLLTTGFTMQRAAALQDAAQSGEIVISGEVHTKLRDAIAHPRNKNQLLLETLTLPPLPRSNRVPPTIMPASPDTLHALIQRISALQAAIPPGLPLRLLGGEGGEFRPVTVLAIHLAGFQKLLEVLEPMAVLNNDPSLTTLLAQRPYAAIQEIVAGYGGYIATVTATTQGDRYLVFFGAPTTHEDDAFRATQVALAMPELIATVNREVSEALHGWITRFASQRALLRMTGATVRYRAGLANGVVFAGIVGTPERHAYTAVGATVQLAVQLAAQTAKDGESVLSPQVRHAVRHAVATQPLPALTLPSGTTLTPHRALQLLTASDVLPNTAPLVGRADELARLATIAARALQTDVPTGQVAVVVGDPGSGKTRLVEEVLHTLRTAYPDAALIADGCQSYEQIMPYAVIARLFKRLLPVIDSAGLQATLDERVPEWSRFAPLLGPLLHLAIPDSELTAALGAEQRRERLHDLLTELWLAHARQQPTILVIDDLHWSDASTQAVVARLTQAIRNVPLLLILPYRFAPEIAEPWRELPYCSVVVVKELDQQQSEAMLATLLEGAPPPEVRPLLERTQGTPFFLEETVRFLLDTGALARDGDGVWQVVRPELLGRVPITVEQLVTARLDRLTDPQRSVVEVAAVVGRRFAAPLVAATLNDGEALAPRLQTLINASLVLSEPESHGIYLFKHALTHDVAYRSMLFARRRQLHGSVATQIERLDDEQLNDERAILAQHYLLAELPEQAFPQFVQAAEHAKERYANTEAIALYEQAIKLGLGGRGLSVVEIVSWGLESAENTQHDAEEPTSSLPTGGDDRVAPEACIWSDDDLGTLEEMVALHESLGDVHALVGHYDAARTVYKAARALLETLPNTATVRCAALHRRLSSTYEKQGRYDDALRHLDTARTLLDGEQPVERAQIDTDAGWIAFQRGNLDDAERLLRTAQHSAAFHGKAMLEATVLRRMAGIHFRRGDLEGAKSMLERSLEISRRIGDQMGVATVLGNLGIVAHNLSAWEEAKKYYNASYTIYVTLGESSGQIRASLNNATAFISTGDLLEASQILEKTFDLAQQLGDVLHQGMSRLNQGRVAFFSGDLSLARRLLINGDKYYKSTNSHFSERSDVCDYLARIAFHQGKMEKAKRLTYRTITLATTNNHILGQVHGRLLLVYILLMNKLGNQAKIVIKEVLDTYVQENLYEQAIVHLVASKVFEETELYVKAESHKDRADELFRQTSTPILLQTFP